MAVVAGEDAVAEGDAVAAEAVASTSVVVGTVRCRGIVAPTSTDGVLAATIGVFGGGAVESIYVSTRGGP